MHWLLEKYFKKELYLFELSEEYEKKYLEIVKHRAPPNPYVDLNKKYYDYGKEYFDEFEGLFDDCKILGIEQQIEVKIGEYNFTGFIDLILEDKKGIIICDHKSKSGFKNKKEKQLYSRQLYMYAIYVFDKYGKYPYKLCFNMFRKNEIIEEEFDINEFELTKQWVLNTISDIYDDTEFKTKLDRFFCNWLCGCGEQCDCSDRYISDEPYEYDELELELLLDDTFPF